MSYICCMKYALVLFFFVGFNCLAQTDTISIVSYNVLNFPDGRDDCGSNTVVPDRQDTLRKVLQYLGPDIFVACEVQTTAGANSILNNSLNVFGATNFAMASFFEDGFLNNSMYYNTDKLTLKRQDRIETTPRAIDHYVLYANDPNLGVYYDTTFIEVYMSHLKAGSGGSNQQIRADQTEMLMDFIATRPLNSNHFFCGDLNVYTSSEGGYQNLITGPLALVDPINSPGSWNNNGSFAEVHTQSTRTSLNYDCGSKGGLDDRFDQILVSQNVMSGADSLRYLENSYDAVGNDGNHFNSNLLSGSNSQYPDSVINALYYMSDHLPVILKAVVTYPTSNGLALYPEAQPVTCHGGADGEATIVANMGQPPYSYLWDVNAGNQTTATAMGLESGTYCVQVTDDLGEVDNYCVFVPQPAAFEYTVFRQPDDGSCIGQATIIISGGQEPYTYSWNDAGNQTGPAASGLCQGEYEVTVTDDAGCTIVISTTIDGPASIGNESNISFKLFPNPAKNQLNIETTRSIKAAEIQISNAMGQMCDVLIQETGVNNYLVNLSKLNKGYYFIQYVTEGDVISKRFVKI
jgi:hypothetical protein